MTDTCQAGHWVNVGYAPAYVNFGDRWASPCAAEATAVLGFGDDQGVLDTRVPKLHFCGLHMQELLDAGMVDGPGMTAEEFIRRHGGS